MDALYNYSEKAMDLIMLYTPKLLLAILTLIIGLWIIKFVAKVFNRSMTAGKVDESLKKFLLNLLSILLKTILLISVASMIGIATTSFVAILGAAGLAVGLALQGSLANFAGGVLILLFKPYKIGDVIEAQGFVGSVSEIQIFNTVLKTPDNKTIIIPNGSISNGNIINYSNEPQRRVDFVFSIGYNDDIATAKNVLYEIIEEDDRILKDPAPMVVVAELADSSVNINFRVWCKTTDYWTIYFDMFEKVKLAFDKAGVSIPFPQQDVHIYREEK